MNPPRFAISHIFLVVLEHDLARQRCLQILFEELAEPGLPEHEVHIHALLAGASASVAESLSSAVRWGQRRFAFATNLACVTHPNR